MRKNDLKMRAVAFSVWIFINLACLGMGGYVYLILSSYWCRESRQSNAQSVFRKKMSIDRENQVVFYEPHGMPIEKRLGGNAFTRIKKGNTIYNHLVLSQLSRSRRRSSFMKIFDDDGNSNNRSADERLNKFKDKLLIRLRTVLHEESNVFKTDNPYFVTYKGPKGNFQGLSSDRIKCKLKKAGLRILQRDELPVSKLKLGQILEEEFLNGRNFKTCAIVSSAGALVNSKLGKAIDNHDIVVRFNHAPTEKYEEDVGAKTTIRLVNSQVVSKKEFMFSVSPLYKNVTLVVWDPSNYSSTLQQWYDKPDFNFFEPWARQRLINSKKNSFILDPRSVWRVWDFIQNHTPLRIRKNPPSSGFLGLVLLMPYCDIIDFFEYVPSIRLTKKCHYFDNIQDDSCTFGVWHPLSAEKMLSLAINEANDTTVFETGFIRVRGFKNLKC